MDRACSLPWAHGPLSGWYLGRNFGALSGTDGHDITEAGGGRGAFSHFRRNPPGTDQSAAPVRTKATVVGRSILFRQACRPAS